LKENFEIVHCLANKIANFRVQKKKKKHPSLWIMNKIFEVVMGEWLTNGGS
jgi:hypothetical protein